MINYGNLEEKSLVSLMTIVAANGFKMHSE